MNKRITIEQLQRAVRTAPQEVKKEGYTFIVRGLREYKRVAVQHSPWRVGQSGGGIPQKSGNLKQFHKTHIHGLSGTFGVNPNQVKYARRVHFGFHGEDSRGRHYNQEARPWLDYAKNKADVRVQKHYIKFLDKILKHIAT